MIRRVVEDPRQPGAPRFFHYRAEGCNLAGLGFARGFNYGGGASTDRDAAMGKAVGEAIERYCAGAYVRDALPLSSFAEAPFPCVDPAGFALYRDDQYAAGRIEFVPYTPELPVRWTPAVDVATGDTVYVPAACVYVPYKYVLAEDPPILQPISTGLACGESYEQALISGASEAIERDSFTIFWQARLAPPRVRLQSLDARNAELVERIARARFDVSLFDVTTDIRIPSVMAVACSDDPSQPALSVAAAAHPVAQVAVRKCLDELEHTRSFCAKLKSTRPSVDLQKTDEILEQEHHLRFWCDQANRRHANWIFESSRERDLPSAPAGFETDLSAQKAQLCDALQAVGLQLLAADITTPEIAELGLRVVRAIVPGLHPLVIGHIKRVLGGRRLYEVPVRLGYPPPDLLLDDPTGSHPFP